MAEGGKANPMEAMPLEEFMEKMKKLGILETIEDGTKSVRIGKVKFVEVMTEITSTVPRIDNDMPGLHTMLATKCEYHKLCCQYLQTLNLDGCFFYPKYDMCYCEDCHAKRGDEDYYRRGQPPSAYGIPKGWCRFGLRTPARANKLKAFAKWHRAFHGTSVNALADILDVGQFVLPGQHILGGRKLSQPQGHYTEDNKPSGFDVNKVFLSPSVHYAGLPVYAKKIEWIKSPDDKFQVQVALQVLVRPSSYTKGKQTVRSAEDTRIFDSKFPNSEIEWSTNEHGSTIYYGILFKIVEVKDTKPNRTSQCPIM